MNSIDQENKKTGRVIYNLTREMELIQKIAKKRDDIANAKGGRRKVDPVNLKGIDMNMGGLYAEVAVTSFLKTDITDLVSYDNFAPYDCKVGDCTVEIKFNNHPEKGDFYFNPSHDIYFLAEAGFLVVPWDLEKHKVRIAGWITRHKFDRISQAKDYGHGSGQIGVSQYFLNPVTWELRDRIIFWLEHWMDTCPPDWSD